MEWYQILTIVAANLAMFFWLRTESNSDRREHAVDRREILSIMRELKDEMSDFKSKLALQDLEFKNHLLNDHNGWE